MGHPAVPSDQPSLFRHISETVRLASPLQGNHLHGSALIQVGASPSACLEGVQWRWAQGISTLTADFTRSLVSPSDMGFPVPGHSSASSGVIVVLQPPSPSIPPEPLHPPEKHEVGWAP